MPVNPSTVVGNIYYLCDSLILGMFRGRLVMNKTERNAQMKRIQTKYTFTEIIGRPGGPELTTDDEEVEEP